MFPPGACATSAAAGSPSYGANITIGAFASILPFLDQGNMKGLYVDTLPWYAQSATVMATPIKAYLCPSDTGPAVVSHPPVGQLGSIQYLLSKGGTQGWCLQETNLTRVGMFGINLRTKFRDITDGTSNTLCVGEGATGGHWTVAAGAAPGTALSASAGQLVQGWIAPQPNNTTTAATTHTTGGNFGATVWNLNRNPVVETVSNDAAGMGTCNDATEFTSNFRSPHEGGGQFLLADGSTRFVSENIDSNSSSPYGVYQHLSSRAGGEVIGEY
jgi:hypothetical protein